MGQTAAQKYYQGIRGPHGCEVVIVHPGGRLRELDPRLDLRRHSPTGFEWGYCGSGPAQLSLALLADALKDDELALRYYQDVKMTLVAHLDHEGWRLSQDEVIRHLGEARLKETGFKPPAR